MVAQDAGDDGHMELFAPSGDELHGHSSVVSALWQHIKSIQDALSMESASLKSNLGDDGFEKLVRLVHKFQPVQLHGMETERVNTRCATSADTALPTDSEQGTEQVLTDAWDEERLRKELTMQHVKCATAHIELERVSVALRKTEVELEALKAATSAHAMKECDTHIATAATQPQYCGKLPQRTLPSPKVDKIPAVRYVQALWFTFAVATMNLANKVEEEQAAHILTRVRLREALRTLTRVQAALVGADIEPCSPPHPSSTFAAPPQRQPLSPEQHRGKPSKPPAARRAAAPKLLEPPAFRASRGAAAPRRAGKEGAARGSVRLFPSAAESAGPVSAWMMSDAEPRKSEARDSPNLPLTTQSSDEVNAAWLTREARNTQHLARLCALPPAALEPTPPSSKLHDARHRPSDGDSAMQEHIELSNAGTKASDGGEDPEPSSPLSSKDDVLTHVDGSGSWAVETPPPFSPSGCTTMSSPSREALERTASMNAALTERLRCFKGPSRLISKLAAHSAMEHMGITNTLQEQVESLECRSVISRKIHEGTGPRLKVAMKLPGTEQTADEALPVYVPPAPRLILNNCTTPRQPFIGSFDASRRLASKLAAHAHLEQLLDPVSPVPATFTVQDAGILARASANNSCPVIAKLKRIPRTGWTGVPTPPRAIMEGEGRTGPQRQAN